MKKLLNFWTGSRETIHWSWPKGECWGWPTLLLEEVVVCLLDVGERDGDHEVEHVVELLLVADAPDLAQPLVLVRLGSGQEPEELAPARPLLCHTRTHPLTALLHLAVLAQLLQDRVQHALLLLRPPRVPVALRDDHLALRHHHPLSRVLVRQLQQPDHLQVQLVLLLLDPADQLVQDHRVVVQQQLQPPRRVRCQVLVVVQLLLRCVAHLLVVVREHLLLLHHHTLLVYRVNPNP